jgi:leucyl aminopeptidase
MPVRLPLERLIVAVRKRSARITDAILQRYPAALLLLPVAPNENSWARVPFGDLVQALHRSKPRKSGDHYVLRVGSQAQTVLVIGVVGTATSSFEQLHAAGKAARAVLEFEAASVVIFSHELGAASHRAHVLAAIAALQAAAFTMPNFKSKPRRQVALTRIDVAGTTPLDELQTTLAGCAGNNLARWLTALPPNVLDAGSYRRALQDYARRFGLIFKFYGEPALKRLGAGAFLAVSQGNATRDAGIAYLGYRPRGSAAKSRGANRGAISLVGKGICFDTGGTNLKPHKSMLDMHTDMEGSAVALGTLHALKTVGSAQPIDCWLAITENRIGSRAYKPQDVVRAANGTTIQVIHTDAEGRMVLADTLSLAARKKPRAIIDYATLTGACVYALTERYSGAFTNRLQLRASIEAAGSRSGERVWCFPMDSDYESDLESGIADVVQCAVEGKGDHILAALFLQRFVPKDIPWLHLDLAAGTRSGGLAQIRTDITGFGVRYTLELLRSGWPAVTA